MPALSEWLQLMLAEIARKRDDLEKGRDEESKRQGETQTGGSAQSDPTRKQAVGS